MPQLGKNCIIIFQNTPKNTTWQPRRKRIYFSKLYVHRNCIQLATSWLAGTYEVQSRSGCGKFCGELSTLRRKTLPQHTWRQLANNKELKKSQKITWHGPNKRFAASSYALQKYSKKLLDLSQISALKRVGWISSCFAAFRFHSHDFICFRGIR